MWNNDRGLVRRKMARYEIHWEDLNVEAQTRLEGLKHHNIDLSPLAIIDIEDEKDEKNNN